MLRCTEPAVLLFFWGPLSCFHGISYPRLVSVWKEVALPFPFLPTSKAPPRKWDRSLLLFPPFGNLLNPVLLPVVHTSHAFPFSTICARNFFFARERNKSPSLQRSLFLRTCLSLSAGGGVTFVPRVGRGEASPGERAPFWVCVAPPEMLCVLCSVLSYEGSSRCTHRRRESLRRPGRSPGTSPEKQRSTTNLRSRSFPLNFMGLSIRSFAADSKGVAKCPSVSISWKGPPAEKRRGSSLSLLRVGGLLPRKSLVVVLLQYRRSCTAGSPLVRSTTSSESSYAHTHTYYIRRLGSKHYSAPKRGGYGARRRPLSPPVAPTTVDSPRYSPLGRRSRSPRHWVR